MDFASLTHVPVVFGTHANVKAPESIIQRQPTALLINFTAYKLTHEFLVVKFCLGLQRSSLVFRSLTFLVICKFFCLLTALSHEQRSAVS